MRCLTYALGKWAREGGYLVIRRSRWGWFPHFLHLSADRQRLTHMVPLLPRRRGSPPIWFRGRIREGDE